MADLSQVACLLAGPERKGETASRTLGTVGARWARASLQDAVASPAMTAPATKEEASDPGGPDAAVNRYRDLTKYLVTIFAAVGALLAAGTQLSSLGRLNLNDYPGRLLAAGVALTVAIAVVVVVIVMALEVLRPVDMTFDQ